MQAPPERGPATPAASVALTPYAAGGAKVITWSAKSSMTVAAGGSEWSASSSPSENG